MQNGTPAIPRHRNCHEPCEIDLKFLIESRRRCLTESACESSGSHLSAADGNAYHQNAARHYCGVVCIECRLHAA